MKSILSFMIVLFFCTGLAAQVADSVMQEEVMKLKTEVSGLKSAHSKLNSKMAASSRKTNASVEELRNQTEANLKASEGNAAGISSLQQALDDHRTQAAGEQESFGSWVKQMFMIIGIAFLVLFLVLLMLVIINRRRINRDYLKLEAKVENTKEAIETEIRDVLKRHEEDLSSIKASMEKGKK